MPGHEAARERLPDSDGSALRNVCVYCGSSPGQDPAFGMAAEELGRHLAEAGLGLVYGGGDVGLMGTTARSVLRHGGYVTGIIPEFLRRRENMLEEAQETIVVPDMHTRKRLMFDRSDAFVALPGGIGTLEELVEQMTWSQLGRHAKPILLLDLNGFWRPLIDLLAHMRLNGFIRAGLELNYGVAEKVEDLVPMMQASYRRAGGQGDAAFIDSHF